MSEIPETNHSPWGILLIIGKLAIFNVGSYFIANYDKVLGAILTTVSIVYVVLKIWNEYLKPKKVEK